MTMSFEALCAAFRVTPSEREQLAWFLAQYRAKAVYEQLKKPPEDFLWEALQRMA